MAEHDSSKDALFRSTDSVSDELEFSATVSNDMSNIQGDISMPVRSSSTLDEPVSVTVVRDLKAIGRKLLTVLVPRANNELLRDWDLWGPLILCLVLASLLHMSTSSDSKADGFQFAAVFLIFWGGAAVVTLNGKLLSGTLSMFQFACVLGYCVLPLVVLLILFVAVFRWLPSSTFLSVLRSLLTIACSAYCTLASSAFLGNNHHRDKKALALYPIWLFYFFIGWLVVSQS